MAKKNIQQLINDLAAQATLAFGVLDAIRVDAEIDPGDPLERLNDIRNKAIACMDKMNELSSLEEK